MRDQVVLVDAGDNIIGSAGKLEAHQKGLLHRAFSVLTINSQGEILLQRRALNKYHSPGLWTNTCCSHPQPGEDILVSASSRLREEMGISAELHYAGKFQYEVVFGNGLTENEIDHVFLSYYDGPVDPDEEEVSAFEWVSPAVLFERMRMAPEEFTFWFPRVLALALEKDRAV